MCRRAREHIAAAPSPGTLRNIERHFAPWFIGVASRMTTCKVVYTQDETYPQGRS